MTEMDPPDPIGPSREPSPGFYRFGLGDLEITVLSDGPFHFPVDLLVDEVHPFEFQAFNVEPEVREPYFRSRLAPSDRIPLETNPVVIDSGERRTLVDSGFGGGENAPPTAGRLATSLRAAGVPPKGIDQVVLTHAHPDHLGGLLDPTSGTPTFPEAEIVLSDQELHFWMSDEAPRALKSIVEVEALLEPARGVLGTLDDRLRTVQPEEEVTTGIQAIASPGHTPGHLALAVEDGGREALLTGDAIALIHAHFEHPDWEIYVDLDREEATRSRRRLLDRAAADEMLILGYHFPFPGLGHALRDGDAYRWYPAIRPTHT